MQAKRIGVHRPPYLKKDSGTGVSKVPIPKHGLDKHCITPDIIEALLRRETIAVLESNHGLI
jgi:hypothetical protein